MKIRKYIRIVPALIVAFAITSCAKEVEIGGGNKADADNVETTLTLQVPAGGFKPAPTRAMGDADENSIREVDVLVFRKESIGAADNTAVFYHCAQTTLVKDADNAKRSFQITVKRSDKPLQFVVIANAHDMVESKVAAFTEGSTLRNDALNALIMETTSAWNSTTATYDPLPMWGQTNFRIITNALSAAATIDMVRAHSRIDVTVNASAQNDFSLTGVWLYNPSTKGVTAPPAWTSGTAAYPSSGRTPSATPFPYTTMTTAGKALIGAIYTFEAPAATSSTDAAAPFLVVAGSWNSEPESYYRIDFAKRENNITTFMPLLRNYHYEVDITSISGRGYPNAQEAAAAPGFSSITANVHQWAQGQMSAVVWDGRDWLAVSETEFKIHSEIKTILLQVATTYTNGWKATVALNAADEAGWVTISGSDSGSGSAPNPPLGTLTLNVVENLTSLPNRTAVITIAAGRLQQTITVVQNISRELSLELSDVEIVFSALNPQSRPLRVEWKPGSIPCAVLSTNAPEGVGGIIYNQPLFTTNPLLPVSDPTNDGGVNYQIKPDAFTVSPSNPFEERRSTLEITASDGTLPVPFTMKKSVLLRQFDYAIRVTGMQTDDMYQQLTTYSLSVRSNDEWEMVIGDTHGVLASVTTTTGEPNITAAGETVQFTMADSSKAGKSATLTFRSTATPARFTEQVVTITMKNNEPNCYIVPPVAGKNTVTIPVSKVFDIWKSDDDLNGSRSGDASAMNSVSGYTTELLWEDEQGLITNVTALSAQNRSGKFTVTVNSGSGVKQGNAVVVLKEKGTIRWSWHIWVCNFDPDQNRGYNSYNKMVIMDRDLGAINTTKGDIGSYGIYYQYGRHSPFPKASATSATTTFKPIYNSGSVVTLQDENIASYPLNARNLSIAISNPLKFYYSSKTSVTSDWDWYSPTLDYIDDPYTRREFWSAYKTDYDPCPEGWKVPSEHMFDYVPQTETFTQAAGDVLYDMQNKKVGLFTTAGYIRADIAPTIGSVGIFHRSWIGLAHRTYGTRQTLGSNAVWPGNTLARAAGCPVRCAKIE